MRGAAQYLAASFKSVRCFRGAAVTMPRRRQTASRPTGRFGSRFAAGHMNGCFIKIATTALLRNRQAVRRPV